MYLVLKVAVCVLFRQVIPSDALKPHASFVTRDPLDLGRDIAVSNGKDSFSVNYRGLTEDEKKQIVDLHNSYRSIIAKNATNIMKVYWDEGLSRTAQTHADHCVHHHDKLQYRWSDSTPGVYVGQNMCSNSSSWEMCIQSWYNEMKNYEYGAGSKTLTWFDIGHFSQVVNWHVSKIGCGYAECTSRNVARSYVCNYGYGQLYSDISKPWIEGKSCADCPDTCWNGLCDCHGKTCYNFGKMDVKTCDCTCLPFYSGDTCEQVNCEIKDHTYCQKFDDDDCRNGVNIGSLCPHQCGKC